MKVLCGGLTRLAPLKEAPRAFPGGQSEVVVGALREHPPARGTFEQALLKQVGLEHVLDRIRLLADGDRKGRKADRSAAEFGRDGVEESAVGAVEAGLVDLEHPQR